MPEQRPNQSAPEIKERHEYGIRIWRRWTQKIWINDEDGSHEKAGGYSYGNETRRKETEAWLRKNLRSTRLVIIPSLACASACFSRSLVGMFKALRPASGRLGKLSYWRSSTRPRAGVINNEYKQKTKGCAEASLGSPHQGPYELDASADA